MLNEKDIFYFYNASFDPLPLIKKNLLEDVQPNPLFLTNAFGVLIDPDIYPEVLNEKRGTVEAPPIPANWHADIAEFGAVFRSIDLDEKQNFVMCELGCAWGCWMNIAGVVAKRNGHSVHLIGVEGDDQFITLARKTLKDNHFNPDEYTLYHGIASPTEGTALFPNHDPNQTMWGFEPVFDVSGVRKIKYLLTGKYHELQQVPLGSILQNHGQIDLLHVDIQGGEENLIPQCIAHLTAGVSYLVIGTHSRQIEGKMFECLTRAGWLLEIERPAILKLTDRPVVTVDGVQGWRNLNLLPVNKDLKMNGEIKINDKTEALVLSPAERFSIQVEITNHTNEVWNSLGPNPINVSYHWTDTSGNMVIFDGERTQLSGSSIGAKETKEQFVQIVSPQEKGKYKLVVTLVQEGKRWFASPDFMEDAIDVVVQ